MDLQILPQTLVAEQDINAEYREALRWLFSFATYQHKTADAYQASKHHLERMRAILAGLGNPHEKFSAVHIAGTKGKGSTAAISESILRTAGIKTGLYTSPHLHTFRERIRVNGEFIPREAVTQGIARLRAIPSEFPDVLVFELITALAFDYFARSGVEFAVIEVGLGGRLDATNVLTPRVSVITSISFDHMAILGNTLAQIANEKAGIIKPGVTAVSSPQTEEARAVIAKIARDRGSQFVAVKPSLEFEIHHSRFAMQPVEQNLDYQILKQVGDPTSSIQSPTSNYQLHLLGAHQAENATTAIAAIRVLAAQGVPVTEEEIRLGVERTRWPGRFEILERAPYLIVDGAHNRDSARQLVATIDALMPGSNVQWVFGASDDKDVRGMFAELAPRSPAFIFTRAVHPRASNPEQLAILAREFDRSIVAQNMTEALQLARARMDHYDVTVITGSLFVVAEARGLILRQHGQRIESDDVSYF